MRLARPGLLTSSNVLTFILYFVDASSGPGGLWDEFDRINSLLLFLGGVAISDSEYRRGVKTRDLGGVAKMLFLGVDVIFGNANDLDVSFTVSSLTLRRLLFNFRGDSDVFDELNIVKFRG